MFENRNLPKTTQNWIDIRMFKHETFLCKQGSCNNKKQRNNVNLTHGNNRRIKI